MLIQLSILLTNILDDDLVWPIDPARQCGEQDLPGLDDLCHRVSLRKARDPWEATDVAAARVQSALCTRRSSLWTERSINGPYRVSAGSNPFPQRRNGIKNVPSPAIRELIRPQEAACRSGPGPICTLAESG